LSSLIADQLIRGLKKYLSFAGHGWLIHVSLATWEVEIRRLTILDK
jgi:hypothetical protein